MPTSPPRTTTSLFLSLGLASLLLGAAPVSWAQGRVDAKLLRRYGGVLAPDCSHYLLPQLKFLGDSLVVQDGGKALLTGRSVKPAPRYFGTAPPPEFETALTSDVAGAGTLVFVFYRNASGLYAAVEGAPKVLAALPAALRGGRARHCDPNRNLAPGAAPPVEIGPADLLKDAAFKRVYTLALGALAREAWLLQLDGPAPPVQTLRVDGSDYLFASACKNHDCAGHNIVLLYAAASQTVYAKVVQRGVSTLLGAPPPGIAAELERLWQAQWRS
jgi:Inhibitor of vertebrate lysozyme (Ivy)